MDPDPYSFGSLDPDPEVKHERFSETAEKLPEKQTEEGHNRRMSPDESVSLRIMFKLENLKLFFTYKRCLKLIW